MTQPPAPLTPHKKKKKKKKKRTCRKEGKKVFVKKGNHVPIHGGIWGVVGGNKKREQKKQK